MGLFREMTFLPVLSRSLETSFLGNALILGNDVCYQNEYALHSEALRTLPVYYSRSLLKDCRRVKSVTIHQLADASNLACSTVRIGVVKQGTDKVKGFLASKSQIAKRNTSLPRLELTGGKMAANMAKNVCHALKRLPVAPVVEWMDSMVALYWITNPGESWKVFVATRMRKIAHIANKVRTEWKCPSVDNIVDPGSRSANLDNMEKAKWFNDPEWLL